MKLSALHYCEVSEYMKIPKGDLRSNFKHKIELKIYKRKNKLPALLIQKEFLDHLLRLDFSSKKTAEVITYLTKKWQNAEMDYAGALHVIASQEELLKEIRYAEQLPSEEYEALFQEAWREYEPLRPKVAN